MKKTITRFAPSPTGSLHIGGLRTALFSYLWAKKNKGIFRLRIEDTDQKREVPGATKQLIDTLTFFGLVPDDETVIQSKNAKEGIYADHARKLLKSGAAYYCFCTEQRLADLRESQQKQGIPSRYDGRCRGLAPDEVQKNLTAGTGHVIRLKVPEDRKTIAAFDGIHGDLSFEPQMLNDAVLLKSDGLPTYHLANVVDDHLMRITHVIRGEEWIPSLPLHILLYEYFKFEPPRFYHVPLILNPDRSKLSKRQGDVSVESYIQQGYLKEAIINYIAFLGWNPGDEREIFSLHDLVTAFDIANLNKAGAIFSLEKLDWYNGWYIKNILASKPPKDIAQACAPFLPNVSEDQLVQVFNLFFERIHKLADLPVLSEFLWKLPDYPASHLIFKKSTHEKTVKGLGAAADFFKQYSAPWTAITIDLGMKRVTQDHGLGFGDIFWPVRVALSGLDASPPPSELAAFLGQKETLSRLTVALGKLRRAAA